MCPLARLSLKVAMHNVNDSDAEAESVLPDYSLWVQLRGL